MRRPRRVVLGQVAGAHGRAGDLRVHLFGDGPENLQRVARGERQLALGGSGADEVVRAYTVIGLEPGRTGEVKLRLEGVASREGAEALAGLLVLADPDQLEPLPDGEYYCYQLLGCAVETEDGSPVGTVREIMETGAHDVLVVEGDEGREILLPFAESLLRRVDLEGARIVMEVPPGLLDPE